MRVARINPCSTPIDPFEAAMQQLEERGETMEPTPDDYALDAMAVASCLRAGASGPTETVKALAADPLEEAMQGLKRWDETLEHTLQLQRETFGDPPDEEDLIKDYRDRRG